MAATATEEREMVRPEPDPHEARGVVIRDIADRDTAIGVAVQFADLLQVTEPTINSVGFVDFETALKQLHSMIGIRLETGSW